jgi:nucleotide-binding universal stress UspA family protein
LLEDFGHVPVPRTPSAAAAAVRKDDEARRACRDRQVAVEIDAPRQDSDRLLDAIGRSAHDSSGRIVDALVVKLRYHDGRLSAIDRLAFAVPPTDSVVGERQVDNEGVLEVRMFKQLLIPLDRSPLSEQAVGRAAAIARATKASIDLVLVHEPFATPLDIGLGSDADDLADEQRYLESVAGELRTGASISVTFTVVRGAASEMICERAKELGADLIVMTSHARTGIGRMWLGSVADAVVRNATIPVLMLRPEERAADRETAKHLFKHILVPLDGSTLAAEALGPAIDLARASGADLTLLRVVAPVPLVSAYDVTIPLAYPPLLPDEPATREVLRDVEEELSEIARRLRDEQRLSVRSEVVVSERTPASIISYARGHEVDVIAMCTHGRGATRLLVGSVADALLRGSGLPVLLQRPGRAAVEPMPLSDASAA